MALNIWDWSLFLVVGFPIDVSVKDNCTLEGASLINFYDTATWINLRGPRGPTFYEVKSIWHRSGNQRCKEALWWKTMLLATRNPKGCDFNV